MVKVRFVQAPIGNLHCLFSGSDAVAQRWSAAFRFTVNRPSGLCSEQQMVSQGW